MGTQGRTELDRRDFLRRGAVTAASVPVILTLSAKAAGAQATNCSAPTNRGDRCPCQQVDDCTPPALCINQGAFGTVCCIPQGAPVRSGTCVGGVDVTCCSGLCDPNTDQCIAVT